MHADSLANGAGHEWEPSRSTVARSRRVIADPAWVRVSATCVRVDLQDTSFVDDATETTRRHATLKTYPIHASTLSSPTDITVARSFCARTRKMSDPAARIPDLDPRAYGLCQLLMADEINRAFRTASRRCCKQCGRGLGRRNYSLPRPSCAGDAEPLEQEAPTASRSAARRFLFAIDVGYPDLMPSAACARATARNGERRCRMTARAAHASGWSAIRSAKAAVEAAALVAPAADNRDCRKRRATSLGTRPRASRR